MLAVALSAPLAVNVPVGAQEARLDRLVQSRSLEQPMPSARRVPLPSDNPLELLPVFGNVYMLARGPSNVAVQIGDEGVLLVDAATAAVSDRVLQAVRVLSDGPLSYIINSTSDPEHYGGNARLGRAGLNPTVAPRGLAGPGSTPSADNQGGGGNNPVQLRPTGAIVIAHENLLNRMNVAPTAEPFEMWPTNSFFTAKKTMWFNDEPIEILHVPAAHSDGDVMVFFRRSDVVAVGDVIHTERYPSFDVGRGGSMRGILDALNRIIDITVPRFNQQGGTRVVPGHGRILNEADVVEYRDMMTIIYERVKAGVTAGHSFEQVMAKAPTLDYDGLYSSPTWTGRMLARAIYDELQRRPAAPSSAP
jgi:glyoxylase-like metal-dependent hydrolase (beta-lactamase superfamily II)